MFYILGKLEKPLRSFKEGDIICYLCKFWKILSKTYTIAGIPIYYLHCLDGSFNSVFYIYLPESTIVNNVEVSLCDEPDLPF